ncbi:septum formation protein [Branchiibius hedensis]|uniref:Nucleoside triphosphate pyrophosphatase n=1 Tax=Branchiibius hedensis TaxID=672460 RepID=A0A2Y9BTZ8_9MICO|nr:Maf family protein [Branchiibius hedensis]PWJ26080.1 septum formation protein [Branchiibius hedensis]SSA34892.1 septum formation protein [Branchiibius hedensis]
MDLVLASASPARLKTLRAGGIEPRVIVSAVDEPATLAQAEGAYGALAPIDVPLLLARAKAQDVAPQAPQSLVLGCDSVLEFEGEVLGKPADAAQATTRWRRMRGHSGVLHTGHWLILGDAAVGATVSTTVHFAELDDDEIDFYVATGEPLQVAGAFTIDGIGGAFISGIEGDHHNVIGVSLPALRDLTAQLGIPWITLLG